jgi:nucleoside-diphosphate-sugar epimerase
MINTVVCSIDNLMFIIKELIDREDIPSGVYNVADDKALSTSEVISILAESKNKKPKIWNFSKGLIKALAKLGDLLRLPLTTERLQKLTESYVVSNQKIKSAIGNNGNFDSNSNKINETVNVDKPDYVKED